MTTPARTISTVLLGCTVLLPVDRRSGELSAALERHGARVRVAPALTIIPHVDDDELIAATRQLVADPPDVVVATTGVGFRGWMETADEAGLHDELSAVLQRARIVARGPKARGAIQQAGFEADWVAESETSAELRDFLVAEGIAGLHVAVQHHGSGADGLDDAFEAAGARVTSLTIYRWGPPPDPEAVAASTRQVARGEIDAVLFTSAPAAREWILAAERAEALAGVASRARDGRVLIAAVGPITAGPLRDAGIDPLVPDRGRLGALVRAVVTHYGGADAPVLATTAGLLGIRSSGIVLDGEFTPLPRTGVEILRALARVPGAVVSRADLVAALSNAEASGHAVEVAVARTREALGGADLIRTVYKRGYRLDVIDEEDS
ncbi:uroporphyrinogen-III synthase [Microbacterium sp. AG157]|uniref:uroporphyrinogen-III synthase n=1 Tax=Microbacterium TaxID=33882 RepID=UPI000CCE0993|nr:MULTISPECIES: uroporphyrinogen-III synthase [Microbacterium]PNW09660.1 uroporphyrinogen-III synthase [Microbacterium testaceum]REC99655.1 uroporphyrinogen-III synthase [Microbacterium sp. AG157]WJS91639.1 uroporphyrinogen-III synthase [Microbacterium testaceum]